MYRRLGQDYDIFAALPEGASFETPSGGIAPADVLSIPSVSYPPVDSGSGWNWGELWGGVKEVLVPVSTAAAQIISATTGRRTAAPTGFTRDAYGRIIPGATQQNWLIPALLIGGGALWYFSRKK